MNRPLPSLRGGSLEISQLEGFAKREDYVIKHNGFTVKSTIVSPLIYLSGTGAQVDIF